MHRLQANMRCGPREGKSGGYFGKYSRRNSNIPSLEKQRNISSPKAKNTPIKRLITRWQIEGGDEQPVQCQHRWHSHSPGAWHKQETTRQRPRCILPTAHLWLPTLAKRNNSCHNDRAKKQQLLANCMAALAIGKLSSWLAEENPERALSCFCRSAPLCNHKC